MNEIRFHLKTGEHGFLANFYPLPRPLVLDGLSGRPPSITIRRRSSSGRHQSMPKRFA
jgi:hypothetical protein